MHKLLLVEDDRVIASIYQQKFVQDGFEVRVRENGRDAIARLAEFTPDIVVLDLNLPILDGFEVLRHLRSAPATAELPVIVFSNAYQPKMIDEAWRLGANAVLMKANTNPRKMADTVNELLPAVDTNRSSAAKSPPESAPRFDAETESRPVLEGLGKFLEGFRRLHDQFLKTQNPDERRAVLLELSRASNGLAGSASAVGMKAMARLAEAYQALLQEMHDRPDCITESTRRTSQSALAAMEALAMDRSGATVEPPAASVLLADGNQLSSRLAHFAFQKAGIDVTEVDHAETAVKSALAGRFNLIVLDDDVPGVSPLEAARQLRNSARTETPIILIYPAYDLANRLAEADELRVDAVAKPYPPAELALRSLSLIHRHRLARASRS